MTTSGVGHQAAEPSALRRYMRADSAYGRTWSCSLAPVDATQSFLALMMLRTVTPNWLGKRATILKQ